MLTLDMQQTLNELRNSEREIEHQQETIDQMEKQRDHQVKQLADDADKVSIHSVQIRVIVSASQKSTKSTFLPNYFCIGLSSKVRLSCQFIRAHAIANSVAVA